MKMLGRAISQKEKENIEAGKPSLKVKFLGGLCVTFSRSVLELSIIF
jgi:hypothetical protein